MLPIAICRQDHGISQEVEDVCKRPTGQLIQAQLEKAQSSVLGDEFESEAAVVRLESIRGDGSTTFLAQPDPKAKSKAKAASQPKRRAASANNPLLAASQARQRSTALYFETERLLQRAIKEAEFVFEVTAPKVLGSEEAVQNDATLELLRNRYDLVHVASDPNAKGDKADKACEVMFNLACQDPYLKDCRSTLMADPKACHTLGVAKYMRQFVFDMCLGCNLIMFNLSLTRCIFDSFGLGPGFFLFSITRL